MPAWRPAMRSPRARTARTRPRTSPPWPPRLRCSPRSSTRSATSGAARRRHQAEHRLRGDRGEDPLRGPHLRGRRRQGRHEKIWVPNEVFASKENFLTTLVVGDQIFINAYLIGVTAFARAGKLTGSRFARYAAEFMGAEAVHRALALQSLGKPGNDRVFMRFGGREEAPGLPTTGSDGVYDIVSASRSSRPPASASARRARRPASSTSTTRCPSAPRIRASRRSTPASPSSRCPPRRGRARSQPTSTRSRRRLLRSARRPRPPEQRRASLRFERSGRTRRGPPSDPRAAARRRHPRWDASAGAATGERPGPSALWEVAIFARGPEHPPDLPPARRAGPAQRSLPRTQDHPPIGQTRTRAQRPHLRDAVRAARRGRRPAG